jgi:prolyl 3-hydroxylase /prolyl 3,4-dihydroxylase
MPILTIIRRSVGKDYVFGPGSLLEVVRRSLFRCPAFVRFLRLITSLDPVGVKTEVRRFRPGLDYTVAYYGVMTTAPRLDATLCFVSEEDEGPAVIEEGASDDSSGGVDLAVDLWDSGDVGAFECYIETSNEGDSAAAAEVYKGPQLDDKGGEGEESLLSVSAQNNVLSLVMRDDGVMRFVKYVSVNAPGSRWDISAEYELGLNQASDNSDDSDDYSDNDSDDSDDMSERGDSDSDETEDSEELLEVN